MRNLKSTLTKLAAAVAEEAGRNATFAATLSTILGGDAATSGGRKARPDTTRKGGRRAPAVLDPVDIARDGADLLRERLRPLELAQLLDIVAEYGMDPGKLVMKWKDPDRVADRIVEMALARATKGDAFRAQ
jgi:hypothetical protein